MSLRYQTHYDLGRLGRVTRSYDGIEAALAIPIDLVLSGLIGAVGFAARLAIWVAWATLRFALELVRIPFRAFRCAAGRYSLARPGPARKVAWAGIEEV